MKTLPPALLSAFGSQQYIPTLLVDLDISIHKFRFTTWSTSIYYNSTLYIPRGFELVGLPTTAGEVATRISLVFDDVDRALNSTIRKFGTKEDPVLLYVASLTNIGKVDGTAYNFFKGVIDNWDNDPKTLSLDGVVKIGKQLNRSTTAKFSPPCRWRQFKGTECQYSGPESECERSYDKCKSLSNTVNFGGQRFVPSLVNRRILD